MANLKNKTFIYVGAGLATAVIGYFVYDLINTNQQNKKFATSKEKKIKPNTQLGTDDFASNKAQSSNDSYPLKIGSYGAKVFVLQEALNKLGQSLEVDGKFGQQTYDAITGVSFGFGFKNIPCRINYLCSLSYDNWINIINKAEKKGFDQNTSWTNAKKLWKV